jgi:hypothetical protein
MGSLLQFHGRRPRAVQSQPAADASAESNEERRSLRIMLWTFALSAIAMCATVVFTLSPHGWLDLLWLSSFMVVFALAKIGLSQLLFTIMINYDESRSQNSRNAPRAGQPEKSVRSTNDGKRMKRILTVSPSSPARSRPRS